MTEHERSTVESHDPLCPHDGPSWCDCDLIAKVRADLRAKVEALYDKGRTRDWDYLNALDDVIDLIDGIDLPRSVFPAAAGEATKDLWSSDE